MAVLRIVPNFETDDPAALMEFYGEVFGLRPGMDMGWIVTAVSEGGATPQISFMREGGGGALVPDISVEVDDLDAVHARAVALGAAIVRPLGAEPWGVRRFFLRDPAGRTVNVLAHL